MSGGVEDHRTVYSDHKLCPDLGAKDVCIVVEQYRDGKIARLVHEHVPAHRISSDSLRHLLKALLLCGETSDDLAALVPFYLNSRGRVPTRRALPCQTEYPEPGVLRVYYGTDMLAWCDKVVDPASFRSSDA